MTKSISLLPSHTHHRIVVVGGVGEIVTHIHLVVGIGEVIHPTGGIGVDVHDISVQEIPRTCQLTVDGLTHDLSLVIDIGSILRDPHLLIRIDNDVGIQVAFLRIQAVTAQGISGIVEHLITIVHLLAVEHLLACHGIGGIETIYNLLLILTGLTRQGLLPIDDGTEFITFLVSLQGTVGLVDLCQAFPENRVTHIVDKLTILGIGYLGLVHPETVNGDVAQRCLTSPEAIGLLDTHLQMATLYQRHTVRCRLRKGLSTSTSHLTASGRGQFTAKATRQQEK